MYKQLDLFGEAVNVYTKEDEKPECKNCVYRKSELCRKCNKGKNKMKYYERHTIVNKDGKEL